MAKKTYDQPVSGVQLARRLRIVRGQVDGLANQVETEQASCSDLLTQLKAVHSALRGVTRDVVRLNLETCISVDDEKSKKQLQDILKLFTSM